MNSKSLSQDTVTTGSSYGALLIGKPLADPSPDAKFCGNETATAIHKEPMAPTSEPKRSPEKQTPSERLQRSRERNRVHARKTRQRKKEQMNTLTRRADDLKQEQVRLKQSINEKNTASILVGLFATAGEKDANGERAVAEDPRVEQLLKRAAEEIPDASKITELPALILPGQHNSKKAKAFEAVSKQDLPDDGIDYQLLGKDRSKCTPEELDKIRRERNRMHAKRTRDRKRLFMEEMADMCKQLEEENLLLRNHLRRLDGEPPEEATPAPTTIDGENAPASASTQGNSNITKPEQTHAVMDQLKTLIEVAGSFENKSNPMKGRLSLSDVASSVATAVSASDSNASSANVSVSDEQLNNDERPGKRRKLTADTAVSMKVLHSIQTVI